MLMLPNRLIRVIARVVLLSYVPQLLAPVVHACEVEKRPLEFAGELVGNAHKLESKAVEANTFRRLATPSREDLTKANVLLSRFQAPHLAPIRYLSPLLLPLIRISIACGLKP